MPVPRQLAAKRLVCHFNQMGKHFLLILSSIARRTLAETEKLQSENATSRTLAEDRLKAAQSRIKEMEAKLEEEGQESSGVAIAKKRLQDELDDEREQHKKDLAERDFSADQTRKKYQGTCFSMSVAFCSSFSAQP